MRNAELLDKLNSGKMKKFFKLNQLKEITGLQDRALKYRMLYVKNKYIDIPSRLKKLGRSWQIHYSIVYEFFPKRKRIETTVYTYPWANIVSWNPENNYDAAYHEELIQQIKKQLPNNKILYAIELDSRQVKHVHFITDAQKVDLDKAVNDTLDLFMSHKIANKVRKEYKLEINKIYHKYNVVDYLRKAPVASGIIN
ncbi:MAG: hypothetical protein JWN78_3101 [Bacteroidota bacterium]|nr:hypothetical protein [Bacteroidota bacterium]